MDDQGQGMELRGWRDGRIWKRGIVMIILGLLFGVAQGILTLIAVLQFGWMLVNGRPNPEIAAFGDDLGRWLAITARYQSGKSDHLPFPWTRWGA
jgi:hypothetical protein